MQSGDLLRDLFVTDLTVQGAGVARAEGRVIFIEGALPESVVHARVTGTRKGTVQARQEEVVKVSPYDAHPWCPHFQECGACLWQHMSPEGARLWKTRHVAETLARIGGARDIVVRPILASPRDREFRNKMSFAFGREGDTLLLGLRQRGGKGIVPVTECALQGKSAMRILARTRELCRELGLDAPAPHTGKKRAGEYLRFLVLRTPEYRPHDAPQILVECITGPEHDARPQDAGGALSKREAVRHMGLTLVREFGLSGFAHSERRDASDVAQGERLIWSEGDSSVTERFGPLSVSVPYNAFMQTNTGAATLLYEQVARVAKLDGTQTVWDLYSGIGSIALYLAPMAREVQGFEIASQAVRAANGNRDALGLKNCSFHAGALDAKVLSSLPSPDIIVADPPRSGIEPQIIDVLRATDCSKILYISCDVATQARDVKRLSDTWLAKESIPVDMFPYTPHVENIVVLNRIRE